MSDIKNEFSKARIMWLILSLPLNQIHFDEERKKTAGSCHRYPRSRLPAVNPQKYFKMIVFPYNDPESKIKRPEKKKYGGQSAVLFFF